MLKRHYFVALFVFLAFAVTGSFTNLSAESAQKKRHSSKATFKLKHVQGEIIEDSAGNANGTMTIKSKNKKVELFYEIGKFKITGAEYFKQGDTVSASYKPEKGADYDGELVSIEIIK